MDEPMKIDLSDAATLMELPVEDFNRLLRAVVYRLKQSHPDSSSWIFDVDDHGWALNPQVRIESEGWHGYL
jgi:hypothetical protein